MNEIINILKVCVRENLTFRKYHHRINEPTMAMAFEDQISAFHFGSQNDGPLAAVQLYAALNASQAIRGSKKVLELGCGTGHVLTKIAYINPDKYFYALDLSPGMLEEAKKLAKSMELTNIEFHIGDMTNLSAFKNLGIDAVTSSLALHHLRSEEDLAQTFSEIYQVIGPKGSFSFLDLGRFKCEASIQNMINLNNYTNPVLKEETINSYLASFTKPEMKKALYSSEIYKGARLKTTLIVPGFIKINSRLRRLNKNQKSRLNDLINELSMQNKLLFKIMKLFFII